VRVGDSGIRSDAAVTFSTATGKHILICVRLLMQRNFIKCFAFGLYVMFLFWF
jgi:hypothetical protein